MAYFSYLKKSIPANPVRCKVLLPSLSMHGMVTKVIVTMIAPTPSVAYGASDSVTPDDLKNINIAVNGPLWVEVANPEYPFTAMLISRSRGTCLISPMRPLQGTMEKIEIFREFEIKMS